MKSIRKIMALLCAMAIFVSALPTMTASAAETSEMVWVQGSDGWTYLQGTNIKVKQDGGMLTIEGSGELPDFDYWHLDRRPWGKTTCTHLTIGEGITYIGSYAFYGLSSIKNIYMHSTTFINDTTCFDGIASEPAFRIYGNDNKVTTRQFGAISVSSMDSIKRMAQTNWNGASYVMDDSNTVTQFQTSTNPTIHNVYDAYDADAPWETVSDTGNGGSYTSICKITTTGISSSYGVAAQKQYPGNACYEVYGAFIGDYNLATTFNITLLNGTDTVKTTDVPFTYTLTIPSEYRNLGTTYKLIAIGEGTVYTYDDLDTNYQTITFQTDKPTTSYALIYK
jgi:hypothetical protein